MKETAFDRTVEALKQQGLNPEEILNELSLLFRELANDEYVVAQKLNLPAENSEADREKEYELRIRSLLLELGIPCRLNGYEMLVEAIRLYSQNPKQKIFEELYKELGEIFNFSQIAVLRNMRYAIERGMANSSTRIYEEKFACKIRNGHRCITNKEFISRCVQILNE